VDNFVDGALANGCSIRDARPLDGLAYAPLIDVLAAPFRATVIRELT